MQRLVIAAKDADDTKQKKGKPQKSRSFGAIMLSYVTADHLWEGGKSETDTIRPVVFVVAGTETELRPFMANLKQGRKAEVPKIGYSNDKPTRYELLKTGGYVVTRQRPDPDSDAWVATAYQHELLMLQPGMIDPEGIQFLSLPPTWWAREQTAKLRQNNHDRDNLLAHVHALGVLDPSLSPTSRALPLPITLTEDDVLNIVPSAARACAYLQARTRRPFIASLAFYLQMYLAALTSGLFTLSNTNASERRWARYGNRNTDDPADPWFFARHQSSLHFHEVGTAATGFEPGVVCKTDHDTLDLFLAEQISIFMRVAPAPITADPIAQPAFQQYALF